MTFLEMLKDRNASTYGDIVRYLKNHDTIDITITKSTKFNGLEIIDKLAPADNQIVIILGMGLVNQITSDPMKIVPEILAFHTKLQREKHVVEIMQEVKKDVVVKEQMPSVMVEVNPPNKCSQLYQEFDSKTMLEDIFHCQLNLQQRLGKDPNDVSFVEKINYIKENMLHINIEFAELIERLPFKYWKKYTSKQLEGFIDEEHKLETWFEFIDMAHFFINIGLALGIGPNDFYNLYRSKNKENFRRQNDGY